MANKTSKIDEVCSASSLVGLYSSRKISCSCGYQANWRITVNDKGDGLVVKEQSGAKCCFVVPNCFLKTHYLSPDVEDGKLTGTRVWKGTLGCKPIWVKKVSDDPVVLEHMTTDGMCELTRIA